MGVRARGRARGGQPRTRSARPVAAARPQPNLKPVLAPRARSAQHNKSDAWRARLIGTKIWIWLKDCHSLTFIIFLEEWSTVREWGENCQQRAVTATVTETGIASVHSDHLWNCKQVCEYSSKEEATRRRPRPKIEFLRRRILSASSFKVRHRLIQWENKNGNAVLFWLANIICALRGRNQLFRWPMYHWITKCVNLNNPQSSVFNHQLKLQLLAIFDISNSSLSVRQSPFQKGISAAHSCMHFHCSSLLCCCYQHSVPVWFILF